ncbi:hypothetical protein KM043_003603 [Ampulex compressa]|nr:hypothetical protein KM043_003603 [Ampulex compressa]
MEPRGRKRHELMDTAHRAAGGQTNRRADGDPNLASHPLPNPSPSNNPIPSPPSASKIQRIEPPAPVVDFENRSRDRYAWKKRVSLRQVEEGNKKSVEHGRSSSVFKRASFFAASKPAK